MTKKFTLSISLLFIVFSSFAISMKNFSLNYIKEHQTAIKVSNQDIADLELADERFDTYSKIHRLWFQQKANGIIFRNGLVSVQIKDGKVVSTTNSGIYDLKEKTKSMIEPSIDVKSAISKALIFNNESAAITLTQKGRFNKEYKSYTFEPIAGITNYDIQAQLFYVLDEKDNVHLAWSVQYHSIDRNHFWDVVVDALSGQLLRKQDLILHCSFGNKSLSNSSEVATHQHEQFLEGTPQIPNSATQDVEETTTGSYRVYPFTVESPVYGTRQLITNPDDAVASPYGWHDTNGVAGAESTKTRGNNVNVYSDKDGGDQVNPTNGVDANYADGGPSLNFDIPLDFNSQLDTLTNSQAVQVQLFYLNNIMHDIMARYGFDDANRNFQVKNYSSGNTATDNDPVNAEAHDGGGMDNANFFTAPDGTNSFLLRSRMQMYMWTGTPPSTLTYLTPSSIAGDIDHGAQSGWGPCSYNVTASVAIAASSSTPSSYACSTITNPSDINGKIALIDRGDCDFSKKVYNAQLAGAVGVIIINRQSAGDSLIGMSGGDNALSVTIPALFVTWADGQKLKNNVATATVTMIRQSSNNCLNFDGALDNGVVAHEYGHGISTRLTGNGPTGNSGLNYSNCLQNAEQAGEGWSDFFALFLRANSSDNRTSQKSVGNYVVGYDANGPGIRRFPYTYDMSINPLTYTDMALSPEEHDFGEIWTSALWDMYILLVEKHGYDNNKYTGNGGNNRALKLVIEGLKLQKCSPGFLDSRDAILKADSILYNYDDRCEIWTAFARRGMGFSAKQGSSNSATDQVAAFDMHPSCNTTPAATANFTISDSVVCAGGKLTFTSTSSATNGGTLDSIRWTLT
ncbi:MAG: M36 family metallopeptidase, partial [Bacteroidetes bacterium]|nr:M36 family metallopeptidase [Bacteroidota bacterium]